MKVQLDKSKVQHSWKEQLSCSGSVDEGPTKNSESILFYLNAMYSSCT